MTLCGTPAGWEMQPPARDDDVLGFAGEAEGDRATQDEDEVPGHVMPMPPGRLFERTDGTHMLGADSAAAGCGEPEVAVLHVGTQPIARECSV